MAERASAAEMEMRAKRLARLLANGARASDCVQFAAERWGVGERQARHAIARARELLKADWSDIQRDQMVAEILSQYSTLQLEARKAGQLHVALGCIHGAAKLAQLVS